MQVKIAFKIQIIALNNNALNPRCTHFTSLFYDFIVFNAVARAVLIEVYDNFMGKPGCFPFETKDTIAPRRPSVRRRKIVRSRHQLSCDQQFWPAETP